MRHSSQQNPKPGMDIDLLPAQATERPMSETAGAP